MTAKTHGITRLVPIGGTGFVVVTVLSILLGDCGSDERQPEIQRDAIRTALPGFGDDAPNTILSSLRTALPATPVPTK